MSEEKPELTIELISVPLFFSSDWVLCARVGKTVVFKTDALGGPVDTYGLNAWARDVIRIHRHQLTKLGIDYVAEYVKYGGTASELP